jgi:hypothetical protein
MILAILADRSCCFAYGNRTWNFLIVMAYLLLSSCRNPTVTYHSLDVEDSLYVSRQIRAERKRSMPEYYVVVSNAKGSVNPRNIHDVVVRIVFPEAVNNIRLVVTKDNYFMCNWGPKRYISREDFAFQLPICRGDSMFDIEISGLNDSFPKIFEVNLMKTTLP